MLQMLVVTRANSGLMYVYFFQLEYTRNFNITTYSLSVTFMELPTCNGLITLIGSVLCISDVCTQTRLQQVHVQHGHLILK